MRSAWSLHVLISNVLLFPTPSFLVFPHKRELSEIEVCPSVGHDSDIGFVNAVYSMKLVLGVYSPGHYMDQGFVWFYSQKAQLSCGTDYGDLNKETIFLHSCQFGEFSNTGAILPGKQKLIRSFFLYLQLIGLVAPLPFLIIERTWPDSILGKFNVPVSHLVISKFILISIEPISNNSWLPGQYKLRLTALPRVDLLPYLLVSSASTTSESIAPRSSQITTCVLTTFSGARKPNPNF
jgi:hypothetical protein